MVTATYTCDTGYALIGVNAQTPVVMSHLPSHDYEELGKVQEEATYEVVDQPRPLPHAVCQRSLCTY